MIRLASTSSPVGTGLHRSGWPFVVDCLRSLVSNNGILLDDFVERSFGWAPIPDAYSEPWVGIFHFPPAWPEWLHPIKAGMAVIQNPQFQRSLPHLRLAISLSHHLADWLQSSLHVPTFVAMLPAESGVDFSPAGYQANRPRQVVQVGWTLRNTRAIYQLPSSPDFLKIQVLAAEPAARQAERRTQDYWLNRGDRCEVGHVHLVDRLHDQEYDSLLASSVVFLEFFDASASTTIVDCIMRNTPLLVNRLPAIEEYLGPTYPLFYDRIEDAAALLTDDRVLAAHEFFAVRDKRPFSADCFRESIRAAVEKAKL